MTRNRAAPNEWHSTTRPHAIAFSAAEFRVLLSYGVVDSPC